MRLPPALLAFVGTLLALLAGPSEAFTCYIILDRTDTVVYRDLYPPVDMSAPGPRGEAAREQLRLRGQFLMFIETDRCAATTASNAYTGSGAATIQEILAVIPNVGGANAGSAPVTGFRSSASTGASSGAGASNASRSSSTSAAYK
jgi:hypothetical protein